MCGLSYKAGDGFLSSAEGKSNQPAVFMDTSGRTFACDAHGLPSARSQGEPLTGRFAIVGGESFEHVIMAADDDKFLLGSDAGYGFVGTFKDMISKNKAGKAYLSLPSGAKVMKPQPVTNLEKDWCLTISNEGRMLLFPLKDLPSLGKGKGNKLMSIPSAKAQSREEYVKVLSIVPDGASLKISAGKRNMTLTFDDLTHYQGERGRRGNKLPRGLQRVDSIEIENSTGTSDSEPLS